MIEKCIKHLSPKISSSDLKLKVANFYNLLKSINLEEKDIPTFNSIEEWITETNKTDSTAQKIDVICASINLNQIGRGELSAHLMISGSEKNTKKGTKGDIRWNDCLFEFKEQKGGTISFAIPMGDIAVIHNILIENAAIIKRTLLEFFPNHQITIEYSKYFKLSDKITEFSPKRFKNFERILTLLKENADSFKEHSILYRLINGNFDVSKWKIELTDKIVESYSGGLVVYTKNKKYQLFKNNSNGNLTIDCLTVGNIKLKIKNV